MAVSAPFTVTNRKPEPYITAPVPNATFPADKPVTLIGDATDPEDGGLSGNALQWQVSGQNVGAGEEVVVNGLAPGAYPVTLTAVDTKTLTATVQATLTILPLGIPAGSAPVIDGVCDDAGYGAGVQVQLKPYSDGAQATVRLVRSAEALWACFSGLKLGGPNPNDAVGLRVDVDNSRDAQMQSGDYGFFVAEDGGLSTYAGNGAGGLGAGPGGLQAQINANANGWNAELRIDAAKLGGWQHLIGLTAGHYNLSNPSDDYHWPYAAGNNQPNTWATTALGDQPQIETVSPSSATAGGPAFSLVVTGTNFLTSTVVLWDGAPAPTTFGSSTQLTATISAANIATGRNVPVVARNPGNLASNPFIVPVQNPAPTISNLTPNTAAAGSGLVTLTVNGSNFVNGAQLLWNQTVLPTTFVSGAQLTAQVNISAAGAAQAAGVTVLNPAPDSQVSNTAPFVVQPQAPSSTRSIYLPLVVR
ncbi:MAG: IPT/TIG domain-containing protein [Caldilineaceae bacterium]